MSTPTPFPPPKPLPCPECQQGKHGTGNCDGSTWSDALDDYVPCPCAERGHIQTPTAPPA